MRTLIDEKSLQARISEMALEIDEYYKNQEWYQKTQEPVVVIGVLTGAIFFMADLVRKLSIRVELDFIRVSTYPSKATTYREPQIINLPTGSLYGTHILLVDDILDTGKTIPVISEHLSWSYPESIRTAVLLRKPKKALTNITADFVGFDIPDKWVAGYGMDNLDGVKREVPFIFVDDTAESDCVTNRAVETYRR